MKDYIYVGSAPYDEECSQSCDSDYEEKSRKECNVYIRQLWRMVKEKIGIEKTDDIEIIIKNEYHDFGVYREVVVKYDINSEQSVNLAYQIDNSIPANWDEISKQELRLLHAIW